MPIIIIRWSEIRALNNMVNHTKISRRAVTIDILLDLIASILKDFQSN